MIVVDMDLFISNGSAEKMWYFFLPKIRNGYGVAALLGGIFYCSRMDPMSIDKPNDIWAESEYTTNVDNGVIPLSEFRKDGLGYGLMRWTTWWRKQSLLNYAKKKEKSIGNIETQLEFIWDELNSITYGDVLCKLQNAKNCREAVDILYMKYMDKLMPKREEGIDLCTDHANAYYVAFMRNRSRLIPVTFIRVTADKAAVRKKASIASKKLGIAIKDDEFQYLTTSRNGKYYSIYLSRHNEIGWISAKACAEPFEKMEKR